MKQNWIEDNIIILSKQTIDKMLKGQSPSDLIALYCFYYYTAKWQRTNIIRCVTDYVAKGLKWRKERVIKSKKELKILGLIEEKQTRNKEGKISGWYIKVNYIWKRETIKNQRVVEPEGGETSRVEKPTSGNGNTNALSANSLNALSANKELAIQRIAFKKEIDSLIELFKPINPSYERLFANKTQRQALERLVKKFGTEKVKNMIEFLPNIFGKPYAPQITTPYMLEQKLGDLISFINKKSQEKINFIDISKI